MGNFVGNSPPRKGAAFTLKYSNLQHQLISPVHLGLPGDTLPQLSSNEFIHKGLWDTGATGSGITAGIVKQLNLKPIGFTDTTGVHGRKRVNVYLISVFLPNMVHIQAVRVTELNVPGFDLLIGMDIIGLGDFAVTNYLGETHFTFRMPSVEHIDFHAATLSRAQRREAEKSDRKKRK